MSSVVLSKKHKGKVWFVELNTPEKRNVLNNQNIQRLTEIFQSVQQDSLVQVIVLSGRGPSFCAGGDLNWMQAPEGGADTEIFNSSAFLFNLFQTVQRCPCPVIGCAHGAVYGGGIGLISVCDIAAAADDTEFCFSELKLSLVPAVVSPFVLQKMPYFRAAAYMLSAQKFSAREAEGLIHFIGTKPDCDKYISSLTDRMLAFDCQAVRQTKILLNKTAGKPPEAVKEYCVEVLARRRKSAQVAAKINRFLKAEKKHTNQS